MSAEGNPILATLEVVLQELLDADFLWKMDEETGFPCFTPVSRRESP